MRKVLVNPTLACLPKLFLFHDYICIRKIRSKNIWPWVTLTGLLTCTIHKDSVDKELVVEIINVIKVNLIITKLYTLTIKSSIFLIN